MPVSKPLDSRSTTRKLSIVTDKQTKRALSQLLGPDDPPIQTVIRNLEIDHQDGAGLPPCNKDFARRLRLRALRLPNLKTRLRLHRGGIQPAALWGIEGQGLAPRFRQALRHALATHLALHKGGQSDVVRNTATSTWITRPSPPHVAPHSAWLTSTNGDGQLRHSIIGKGMKPPS